MNDTSLYLRSLFIGLAGMLVLFGAPALIPTFRQEAVSLFAGACGGAFNIWHAHRETKRIQKAVLAEKKIFPFGMATRLAVGVVIAMLYVRFPEQFRLLYLVIGLFSPYLLLYALSVHFSKEK